MIARFVAYGQWANRLMMAGLAKVPEAVLIAPQPVVFGSILRTAHHVLAMGEVWRAHLTGGEHGFTSRNPELCPPLGEIAARLAAVDDWYGAYVAGGPDLGEVVRFGFIDGGEGAMTRGEILLHVVNHATYHRGHIGAMLNGAGFGLASSDLPVFAA